MPDLAHATTETLRPLEALIDPAYPEKLREIATHLYLRLLDEELGQSPERLAEVALGQTEFLSAEMGGGDFYMVKGTKYRLSRRDKEIVDKVNRTGDFEGIGKQYGLSDMRVRQIYNAWREQFIARNQGRLDLPEPETRKTAHKAF